MKRILYVEDDPINAFIMERLLKSDFIVTHVEDGESCLRKFDSESFDLVLMDINLGCEKIDGIQTMKKLRVKLGPKSIPVFAVTSYAMPEDESRFLMDGFDCYVPKPIERDILKALINKFLPE